MGPDFPLFLYFCLIGPFLEGIYRIAEDICNTLKISEKKTTKQINLQYIRGVTHGLIHLFVD